jgi:hypothetical protein
MCSFVLSMQHGNRRARAEQLVRIRHVGHLHLVRIGRLQPGYGAAIAAHTLDEFVSFSAE